MIEHGLRGPNADKRLSDGETMRIHDKTNRPAAAPAAPQPETKQQPGETDPLRTERPIDALWLTFRRKINPSAGHVQLREMRRAFYAGAQALYTGIMAGLTPGPDAEADDVGQMLRIQRDLERFAADLRGGRE